jgi:hypothetical protein
MIIIVTGARASSLPQHLACDKPVYIWFSNCISIIILPFFGFKSWGVKSVILIELKNLVWLQFLLPVNASKYHSFHQICFLLGLVLIFTIASLLTTDFVCDTMLQSISIIFQLKMIIRRFLCHYFYLGFIVMLVVTCLLAANLVALHICASLCITLCNLGHVIDTKTNSPLLFIHWLMLN